MKQIVIILTVLVTSYCSAQNINVKNIMPKQEFEAIEKTVDLFWTWDKDDDPKNAVMQLDSISKKYTDNWVAPYWASYISTQIANSIKGEEEYLNKAQDYYDKAESALSESKNDSITYSYFKGLQSLIYRLKSFKEKDSTQLALLKNRAAEELNSAVKLNPNNPVVWVLCATDNTFDFKNNISHRLTSLALLKDAKNEFNKIKDRNKADITYWNEHWIKPWINGLKPKKMN